MRPAKMILGLVVLLASVHVLVGNPPSKHPPTLPSPARGEGNLGVAPALPAATGEGNGVVQVTLKAQGQLAGKVVRLGDIAVIEGGTRESQQRLAELDLADCPASGREVALSRDIVYFRMRLAGFEPAQFRLAGAFVATVAGEKDSFSKSRIVKCAEQAVRQRLAESDEEISVTLARPVALPEWDVGADDAVRLNADIRGSVPLGRVKVDVTVVVNGQKRGIVPVFVDVACTQAVAVVKRRVVAGEILRTDSLEVERVWTDGKESFLRVEDCTGKRAKIALMPNQRVKEADLEAGPPPDIIVVKNHETVRLFRVGGFQVSALGEAMQDGQTGQTIRVRNLDSNKIVSGRVVERAVVEVDY